MKKKNYLIIIISVIILSIIGYFLVRLYKYERIKHAKVEVTLVDNLKIEFLSQAKVSDFITSINGTIINDFEIDTKSIGTKDINLEFINEENIKVPYHFTIEVVDTVPPVVWLNSSYTIYKGNSFNYESILCGDNEDNNPECIIEGEYDINKTGTYPLVFKATDRSHNENLIKFNLKVIDRPKSSSSKPNSSTPSKTNFLDVYQNFKTKKTKIGLDVSGWQGNIDFTKIKEAGVEFIIIKVGGTVGTNKDYYVDSKFLQNIKAANELGIDVGLYFYSYASSEEEAKNDALWLLEQIKGYEVNLPIAFDWENRDSFNNYHLSFYSLTNMANAFLKEIENAGYQGMLYSSKIYLERLWLPVDYQIWLAHYTKKTNYQGDYTFWQICNDGQIEGIDGDVDIDIMYLNEEVK